MHVPRFAAGRPERSGAWNLPGTTGRITVMFKERRLARRAGHMRKVAALVAATAAALALGSAAVPGALAAVAGQGLAAHRLLARAGAAAAAAVPGSHGPVLPSLKGTTHPALHVKSTAQANSAGIPIDESGNWSGYVALPKQGGSKTFNSVTAQYTVPSVNCSVTGSSDAFAYHWVGLDGWTDGTVEQDGVADFCVGGTPEYYAWYEMFPAGITLVFAVNPGDDISSSVTYAPSTGVYTLGLTDRTSGHSFVQSEKCATSGTCHNSSAEVITEGYPSGPWVGTADFGAEFYMAATATDAARVTGSFTDSAWTAIESVAYGPVSHQPMTGPGQIYLGESFSRSAFVVNWNRVN